MRTPDERRAANAAHMQRARRDPVRGKRIREIQRECYRNGGAIKQQHRIAAMKLGQPFRWRAQVLRSHGVPVTEDDLRMLWDSQEGRCALTGRVLEPLTAHLDHRLPLARGGTHEFPNLRWFAPEANRAKSDLTDEEFAVLCSDVAEWIGRRLMEAHA